MRKHIQNIEIASRVGTLNTPHTALKVVAFLRVVKDDLFPNRMPELEVPDCRVIGHGVENTLAVIEDTNLV